MAKNINTRYKIFKYLTANKNIQSLSNIDKLQNIWRVGVNGNSFDPWQYDSLLNAFDLLESYKGYYLISKPNSIPYNLYLENDYEICSEIINKRYRIALYRGPTIPISSFSDKIITVFSVADNGESINSWDSTNEDPSFNSLTEFTNDTVYIIISNESSIPYFLWNNCPEVCFSNEFDILLDSVCPGNPETCYDCYSNVISLDLGCSVGSGGTDCPPCYSLKLNIPVACA